MAPPSSCHPGQTAPLSTPLVCYLYVVWRENQLYICLVYLCTSLFTFHLVPSASSVPCEAAVDVLSLGWSANGLLCSVPLVQTGLQGKLFAVLCTSWYALSYLTSNRCLKKVISFIYQLVNYLLFFFFFNDSQLSPSSTLNILALSFTHHLDWKLHNSSQFFHSSILYIYSDTQLSLLLQWH